MPREAIEAAVEEVSRDRSALSLVEEDREIDKLLKHRVKVSFPEWERGGQRVEVVRVIDLEVPENNDFVMASQLWVAGELYLKRPAHQRKRSFKFLIRNYRCQNLVGDHPPRREQEV